MAKKARKRFDEMYENRWFTLCGCAGEGERDDWKEFYQELFDSIGIGKIKEWVFFTGKDLNEYYGVIDNPAWPVRYPFLAFPTEGLDMEKLTAFKSPYSLRHRWFDEVIDKQNMIISI